jgi:hypothetical protein
MASFLCAGEIGDPTQGLPAGAGAKLYYLSPATYGNQPTSTGGADSLLYIRTDDVPMLSEGGRALARRLTVKFFYEGACTISVQPILDFIYPQAAKTMSYAQPLNRVVRDLTVPLAVAGTHHAALIQVLARVGAVGIMQVQAGGVPLAQVADFVTP